MSKQLWKYDARRLARMIANKEVSSREVVTAHLERIDEVNGHLNAVVRRIDDVALAAADDADRATARGESRGPLHGVPFTIKENIDVAGTPTTSSLPALAEAFAAHDAPIVERMKGAGGITLARTNLPEMGLRVHTDSSLHGLARNPWHPGRTTGGSSGGEGSALASGMSPIGLGNDIGGSLRNPAHCCGISSIKPTQGLLPSVSEIPPTEASLSFQIMAVEGVMARRIADVRVGFDVVRGAHPRDPFSVSADLRGAPTDRAWRVAVLANVPGGRTDAGIAAVVRRAGAHLASLGHEVEEATPPDYERTIELWAGLLNSDLSVMKPMLDSVMGDDAKRFLEFGRATFPSLDATGMTMLHLERHGIASKWSQWFAHYDVVLSPTWALPAFEHGFDVAGLEQAQVVLETFRPVLPFNLFGAPAAVVPAGMSDGLPVGVQVGAWRFDDLVCLDVAETIDAALGLDTPIDPIL